MLLAFDLLMRELNVSRAAKRMFVTQSAMSQILQRLRQQFDDPLLVKTATGMQPTERALSLVEPVRLILRDVSRLLETSAPFDPGASHERFAVAGSDYIEFLVLPRLIERVRREAPHVEIHVSRTDAGNLEARLESGELDLALGFDAVLRLSATTRRARLFQDTVVCVASASPGGIEDSLSVEDYLKTSQLLISSCDMNAVLVERWLSKQGMERRVAAVVPNFLSAPFTVASTDLLLSLPRRIAAACVAFSPLKIVEVPLGLPPYEVVMAWHPVKEKGPAHQWLREQVLQVSREIDSAA
ncbi:MAG: LysR family transcriptional regulator [Methylococcaceae bacterium]|nr:LysR family transcriptional regulator [Methylococcaceae bacterium]